MQWTLARAAMVAGVAAVTFTGCLQESGITSSHAANTAPPATTSAPIPVASGTRAALPDFSTLVEQVGPAVVNISVTSVDRSAASLPFSEDDPFFEFFRRFGVPIQPGQPGQPGATPQPRVNQGVGSGFIVSADGFVLTNAHVVANASTVTVRLTDKREFKAKVVGTDRRTDVALLKIDATGLPAVRMGDAEKTKVGEWVVAVGSPFGFENTVTAGIISAKARRLPDESFVPFLQTDVAINPGNSGGPLFNLNGEVVGINSQIYSRSGGFMGISFAIPIDVAMKVKDQLQKFGKVSRGKLGVVIQNMDRDLALSFGLEKPQGALVNAVEPDGPAAKAGVQAGDIILQVDNTQVEDSSDLPRIIGERRPDETVRLKIWRDKAGRDINVKLGEQANESVAAATPGDSEPGGKLGLMIRELQASELSRYNVPSGLLVESASGPAAQAGLRTGDVLLAINNTRITSAAQFRKLVEAAGKRIPLLIQRGNVRQFIAIQLN